MVIRLGQIKLTLFQLLLLVVFKLVRWAIEGKDRSEITAGIAFMTLTLDFMFFNISFVTLHIVNAKSVDNIFSYIVAFLLYLAIFILMEIYVKKLKNNFEETEKLQVFNIILMYIVPIVILIFNNWYFI